MSVHGTCQGSFHRWRSSPHCKASRRSRNRRSHTAPCTREERKMTHSLGQSMQNRLTGGGRAPKKSGKVHKRPPQNGTCDFEQSQLKKCSSRLQAKAQTESWGQRECAIKSPGLIDSDLIEREGFLGALLRRRQLANPRGLVPGSPVAGGGLADVGYLAGGWHRDVALCGHVAAKPPFSWAKAGVSCA